MILNKQKRKNLENKGLKFGSTEDFLGLTDEESSYIEMQLRLSGILRRLRTEIRFA